MKISCVIPAFNEESTLELANNRGIVLDFYIAAKDSTH